MVYKVNFIRNGLTKENFEGRFISYTDEPISPEGFAQLSIAMENFDYPKVEKVYISPTLRAAQTARLIYPDLGFIAVPQLADLNLGEFEGKNLAEINMKFGQSYVDWIADSYNVSPPSGETGADFAQRIMEGLDNIFMNMGKTETENVSIICSDGVIMTLLATFGYPKKRMTEWSSKAGCGFTVKITPALWMRDKVFEIINSI